MKGFSGTERKNDDGTGQRQHLCHREAAWRLMEGRRGSHCHERSPVTESRHLFYALRDGKEHRQSSFSEELVGLVDRQLGTQVSLHCE